VVVHVLGGSIFESPWTSGKWIRLEKNIALGDFERGST